ncbi:Cwf15/Cwc15 cell cycle control protein [Lactarius akahatsu]|uniref:Cwf15/Cwc15 cell cycle control protein n=1 Tax=Lactarius akahatsu TaxID=416441 RepID=A0AAD4LKT0_9AGAM|nr:Cwf15/Cwc15 cell cycle control protein [Lactarius akahatsu]
MQVTVLTHTHRVFGAGGRPTWDPAQAREVKGGSRQYSVRDMAAHTKLKFRKSVTYARTSSRRRLAPRCARQRVCQWKTPQWRPRTRRQKSDGKSYKGVGDGQGRDKDEGDGDGITIRRGMQTETGGEEEACGDDDEEDVTAELLRELEKIKRERAAEQAHIEQADVEPTEAEREARIATANPLLNFAAALGNALGINTTAPGTFAVKRRWDDDLVFKNQAIGDKDKPQGQIVNDLLRTEFPKFTTFHPGLILHRKFMSHFIK